MKVLGVQPEINVSLVHSFPSGFKNAIKITNQNVLLVSGGFHLVMDDGSSIRKKAMRLKELGVRHVAPSHCSGGEAMKIFAGVYGDRFLHSGAGRTITANDIT